MPNLYTTLKPFIGFFAGGLPCLTYHKIAPRPRKTRIKGLYVDPILFKKQMRELATTDFTTTPWDNLESGLSGGKHVLLSFDDGFVNAFENALLPLADYKFRAIQFLVADYIGQFNRWEVQLGDVREPLMDEAQIKTWISAGHGIGAHTLTHPFLTRVSFREAKEEIFSSKKKLEDRFGVAVRHFCYPYGDRNEAIQELVREAGYETASTTEFGVNTPATEPLELRRIMARHRSISIKAIKARLAR